MDTNVAELIRRGQFAEVERIIRTGDSRIDSPEMALFAAEVWHRVGKDRQAARAVDRLLANLDLDPSLRARCLILLGSIEHEGRRHEEAARAARQAIALAKEHRLTEQLCWAELRLFVVLFELDPASASPLLLSELRRHVMQLGSTLVAAALHVSMSEVEAKRGAVSSAKRHAAIARRLSTEHENLWLEEISTLAASCAEYLGSNIQEAYGLAVSALNVSRSTGNIRNQLAAYLILGHIELGRNNVAQARHFISEALRSSDVSARGREAVVEARADLALAANRFDECRQILGEVFESQNATSRFTHPRLWSHRTLAKCFNLEGRWTDAFKTAERGLEAAVAVGDKSLIAVLTLLRAEASAALGEFAAAATDVEHALRAATPLALEMSAEVQRVIARALAFGGSLDRAEQSFLRSVRILSELGLVRIQEEVVAQAAAVGIQISRATETAVSDSTDRMPPDLVLESAGALFHQAERPSLLAAEVADILTCTGLTSRLAITATPHSGVCAIQRSLGWTHEEALAVLKHPDAAVLTLGTWRDAEWQLVADIPLTVSARSAWLAIRALVSSALELAHARREAREREALWPIEHPDEPSHGVFGSEQMLQLLRVTKRVAASPVTVLITGETGVGKEVFARILHEASPRAGKAFVPLNCSAVPRDLMEDQLFGHRRGAFTGADSSFPGVLRSAAGGTVFLDEVGEIALDLQPKLLRFLESSEVHPLGEPHPVKVDVRLVAATNQDLDKLVREGRFREDLYYRLNVIRLPIPPLRERREEIPLLVTHFLEKFARECHKGRLRVAEETMEYLVLYAWPGNVRQLANQLRRLVVMAEVDAVLMPEHLSPELLASRRTKPASDRDLLPTEVVVRLDQPMAAATEHVERAMIQHAMMLCHGRVEQVARMLGLSRKGLYLKRRRLKLDEAAV